MGGMILEQGLVKLTGGFTARDFLAYSTGPFSGWYASLIPYTPVFDPLIIWSEILIGIALISGALVRFVSFCAAIMMMLFYLAYIPSPAGWVNYQLIYALLFVALLFAGSGYFLGLDRMFYGLEKKKHPLRFLFG